MHENEISAMKFSKLAHIDELHFFLWMNNDNYNLDVMTRAAIVGYLNTHKK